MTGETCLERCEICAGSGGWRVCLSDDHWCAAHPRPGGERHEAGTIAWSVIDRDAGGSDGVR